MYFEMIKIPFFDNSLFWPSKPSLSSEVAYLAEKVANPWFRRYT